MVDLKIRYKTYKIASSPIRTMDNPDDWSFFVIYDSASDNWQLMATNKDNNSKAWLYKKDGSPKTVDTLKRALSFFMGADIKEFTVRL